MDNGTLSASDVALLSGNNGFGGWGDGGAFMWIFALLILAGGGFNGFGNNFANSIGFENLATSNEVQRGFDNQNLQAQTRDILAAVNNGTAQSVAATNQSFHDSLAAMQSLYNETARDISDLRVGQSNALANQNECCCETKQMIMQSNYDGAMRDAATNANFTAQIQSVKDMIAQDKIESLQAQVSQLQLAQATAGVLRFPNQWSYGAGPFPPIFGGCCGNI
ncbi:MAG: hypothetical protein IJI19_06010 [Ruminococcus sp.]|nr:hypothetical protein [Ruminococcus sp.]